MLRRKLTSRDPGRDSMRRPRTATVAIAATLLVSLLQGCGMTGAKERALAAVTVFHRQLNAGDFNSIWNGADDAFKANASREDYEEYIQAVRDKLGKAVRTSTTHWFVRSRNLKTMIVLVQQTQFERGSGQEEFTFIAHGNIVKLAAYSVNSNEPISGDVVVDSARHPSATEAPCPGKPHPGNCAALRSS